MCKRALLFFCLICPVFAVAQHFNTSGLQFTRLSLGVSAQDKRPLKDAPGINYQYSQLRLAAFVPVYTKIKPEDDPFIAGIFTAPSFTVGHFYLGSLWLPRNLVNTGLSAGGYYARSRHFVMATLRASLNEDEFTIDDPVLRYNFLSAYTYRTGKPLTLTGGLGYSYIFGEGLFYPVAGFNYHPSSKVNIKMLLPLLASLSVKITSKITYSLSLTPNGGINRFENRLVIPDTTEKTVLLRRRSFCLANRVTVKVNHAFSFFGALSLLAGQRITFAAHNERAGTTYFSHDVSNAWMLQAGLVWKPWVNGLRNANKPKDPDPDDVDDEVLLGL